MMRHEIELMISAKISDIIETSTITVSSRLVSPAFSMRGVRFMFYNRKYLSCCWWCHGCQGPVENLMNYHHFLPSSASHRWLRHNRCQTPPISSSSSSSSPGKDTAAASRIILLFLVFNFSEEMWAGWQPWQLSHRRWWIELIFLNQSVAILARHKTPTLKLNWIM